MTPLIFAIPALVAAVLAWDAFRRWLSYRREERELGAGARLNAIAADLEDTKEKLSAVITYTNGLKIAAGRRRAGRGG